MPVSKRSRLPEQAVERTIPVALLEADPDNIRLAYDGHIIDQLCQAVSEDGAFLQPPRVYRTPQGKFRTLSGSTRVLSALKAHQQGTLSELTVVETSPPRSRAEKILVQLAENETRAQLGPVDRGRAFKMLRDEGLSYREILAECERKGIVPHGRTKGWVSQLISLTELEPNVQRMVNRGDFSINHALLLRKLPSGLQQQLAERIVAEGLGIAAFEELVENELRRIEGPSPEFLYRHLSDTLDRRATELIAGGGRRQPAKREADRRNGPVVSSWTLLPALGPGSDAERRHGALDDLECLQPAAPQVRALALEAIEAGHQPERAVELAASAVRQCAGTSDTIRELLRVLASILQAGQPPETGGAAVTEYVRMRLRAVLDLVTAGSSSEPA